MNQNNKKITNFLFVMQGVGMVFVGIFLAAYLGGLFMDPPTTVLHSEPAFRIPLAVFGVALLVVFVASAVLAVIVRSKQVKV